jgi:hypothetical protein
MSAAEIDELERLMTTLKKPSPSAITRRLNRHISTVTWHMLTRGLLERAPGPGATEPYERGAGVWVYPWTVSEDERLLELRIVGASLSAIAKTLSAEFGTNRDYHKVRTRSIILAARPDEAA